jgi:tetratricopeptide (TPR) repeat protein
MNGLRRHASTLMLAFAAAPLFAQSGASPPQTPAQGSKPSFTAAGVEGSTAPSGYSTGISREETSAVSQGVNSLAPELVTGYVSEWPSQNCRNEADLLRAVHANPQAYEANRALGLFYLEHGEFSQSISYLEAAHRSRPAESDNLYALVLALIGGKQTPRAIDLLQSALATSGQNAALLRLLGLAYQTAGSEAKAGESYQHAIALATSDAGNLLAAGLGLIATGAPQQATELFQSATVRHPQDARLWLGLGIGQDMAGRKPEAVRSLLQAIAADGDLAAAYVFLAAVADSSAESASAIRGRLAEFAVAHPASAEAHYDYALALWLQRRVDFPAVPGEEIEPQLKLALQADPAMAKAHYLLGLFYGDAGDLSRAELELAAAVRLDPENAEAHYHLAQDYQRTHDTQQAAEQTRQFLALRSDASPQTRMEPDLAGASLVTHMALAAPCRTQP